MTEGADLIASLGRAATVQLGDAGLLRVLGFANVGILVWGVSRNRGD